MTASLRTAQEVADDLKVSEWTVLELVRQKKVSCVRIGTQGKERLVRFTDEQVAQIVAQFTVEAPADVAPRRRKRRAS